MDEPGGTSILTGITASTVVKASPGRVSLVSGVGIGSSGATIHDCATVGAANDSNMICVISSARVITSVQIPCSVGITILVGSAVPPTIVPRFAVSYI